MNCRLSLSVFISILLSSSPCIASKPKASNSSPTAASKPRLVSIPQRTHAHSDFLVTPNDFKFDEDVCYLLEQLHRPQAVEKFYRSAAQIYADMPVMYGEIQGDAELAVKFLDIMKRLAAASLNGPLTVTNFIFAFGKHLRPLFKTRSEPIEKIAQTLVNLEKDPQRTMIIVMTTFFYSYTLRELSQLVNFIELMSLATLTATSQLSPRGSRLNTTSTNTTDTNITSTNNTNTNNTSSNNKNTLDISKTSLAPFAERIRVVLANATAKMLILLDIFVNDPSVPPRSEKLIQRLWRLHLNRLAQREGVAIEELDEKWLDPAGYRKLPINFSFEDWAPEAVSAESMVALKDAAVMAQLADDAALANRLAASQNHSKFYWTPVITITFILAFTVILFYIRRLRHQRKQQQQQQQKAQLEEQEPEFGSSDDIVSKLERNILQ